MSCTPAAVTLIVVGAGVGLPLLVYPEEIARLSERLEAIGRRHPGTPESVPWHVRGARLAGALLLLLGGMALATCTAG